MQRFKCTINYKDGDSKSVILDFTQIIEVSNLFHVSSVDVNERY